MSEGTIRGVLFDKDGTLVDFHRTWMPAYRHAALVLAGGSRARAEGMLCAAGYEPSRDRCRADSSLACGSLRDIAFDWARELGHADQDALATRLETLLHETVQLHPVTGARHLIERLGRRGLAMGLATMDAQASAHAVLDLLGVRALFGFVCGADSGLALKPAPDMVYAFARRAGLDCAAIAVVGDTPHDLRMARAARAGLVVGVLTGASEEGVLAEWADVVLASVADLEPMLR